jgi:hypothetical protein
MSSQQLVDFVREELKTVKFFILFSDFTEIIYLSKEEVKRQISVKLRRKVNFQSSARECLTSVWHHLLVARDVTT